MKDAPIFVVINLRGGADALNVVVPHGDADYARARRTLSIPAPKTSPDGALDLDGFFGLHPALAQLLPLWKRGALAIVHAVGWPGQSHSHFEAWDEIESGVVGEARPSSGWLARALRLADDGGSPLPAVAFASTMPRLLSGCAGAVALTSLDEVKLAAPEPARFARALTLLHEGASSLSLAGRRTLEALEVLERTRPRLVKAAGRFPATPFGRQISMIQELVLSGVGLRAASAELGGWDTHIGQGGIRGPMAERLSELAASLRSLADGLGEAFARVRVVVMSEFGRRVVENGSGGTDHGQAGVMFVLGGGVRGGRVLGEWPGLSSGRLADPGDLAITTDFRDVLCETLPADVRKDTVFPGFARGRRLGLFAEAV